MDIGNAKKVCIDTMIFAYHFGKHPKYSTLIFKLFEKIEKHEISACTSIVSLLEILSAPEIQFNQALEETYKNLFINFPNLNLIQLDISVSTKAAELRRIYKIKLPDSVILATAIVSGADILITNDLRLKQIKEIKIVTLDKK